MTVEENGSGGLRRREEKERQEGEDMDLATGPSFKPPLSGHYSISMGQRVEGHFFFLNYFLLTGSTVGTLEWKTLFLVLF